MTTPNANTPPPPASTQSEFQKIAAHVEALPKEVAHAVMQAIRHVLALVGYKP